LNFWQATRERIKPLRGLPAALPFESPASWLSRAAQSQGVRAEELLRYLRLRPTLDIDFEFLSPRYSELVDACGLHIGAFIEAAFVMASVREIDPAGTAFLFRSGRRARYRFCPRCFEMPGIPHFTLACRIDAWRSCPTHRCLLEENCWRCGVKVELPLSPGIDRPRRENVDSLAQCQHCGSRHRDAPIANYEPSDRRFSFLEHLMLENGQSVPAALFQGEVVMDRRVHPLPHLMQLVRWGLLPRKGRGPTAASWRIRGASATATVNAPIPRGQR